MFESGPISYLAELGATVKLLLARIGMSDEEVLGWAAKPAGLRTLQLMERYHSELAGRPLADLLKAIVRLGDEHLVASLLVTIIEGPPVAGQLLALRISEKPEWRAITAIDAALTEYLSDFDNLTQAFSYYQDHHLCGCKARAECPVPT